VAAGMALDLVAAEKFDRTSVVGDKKSYMPVALGGFGWICSLEHDDIAWHWMLGGTPEISETARACALGRHPLP